MFRSYESIVHILVVEDSVEAMRQPHADRRQFFQQVAEDTVKGELEAQVEFVSGRRAQQVLSVLDETAYAMVIFASNAIIRRDGPIFRCLEKHKHQLRQFVESGRSVVIFHQGFAGNESSADFLAFAGGAHWEARPAEQALNSFEKVTLDESHPLLNFPGKIGASHFVESETGLLESGFPLCYFGVIPSEGHAGSLQPVIKLEGLGLCALGVYDTLNGSVIFCPYPADWALDYALVGNIFSFCLFGPPKTLAASFQGSVSPRTGYLRVLKSRLGISDAVNEVVFRPDGVRGTEGYALKHSKLIFFDDRESFDKGLRDSEIMRLVDSGAVLATAQRFKQPESVDGLVYGGPELISLLVGPTSDQRVREDALSELAQLSRNDFFLNGLIHDVRDAYLALLDAQVLGRDRSLSFAVQTDIETRCNSWLQNGQPSTDPGTAAICLWLLQVAGSRSIVEEQADTLKQLSDLLHGSEFKVVVDALVGATPTEISIASLFAQQIEDASLGKILRCLDVASMTELLGVEITYSVEDCRALTSVLLKRMREWEDFFDADGANLAASASIMRHTLRFPREVRAEEGLHALVGACFNHAVDVLSSSISEGGDLRALLALAVVRRVELLYPLGVSDILNRIQDPSYFSSDHRVAQAQIQRESTQKLVETLDQVKKLEIARDELHSRNTLLAKTAHDSYRPWVVVGATATWFVGLVIVLFVVWTGVESIQHVRSENDPTGFIGAFLAGLPLAGAYFGVANKNRLFSFNPQIDLQEQ